MRNQNRITPAQARQSHLYIHADRYACKTECEPAFNWLFTCRSHYIISVSSGK